MNIHEGGCLCGAVRFKVEGDPIVAGACYCRDCQYVSGGSAAYGMMYPVDALTVMKGEPHEFAVTADNGNDVLRHFCPACGVHLFSNNSGHPEFKSIKAGVFDDPSGFRSQGSVWTSSAQSWHRIDPDLPRWEKQPDF